MTVMDVADILGPPGHVRFSKDRREEVWQYCLDERFKPVNHVTVVWFCERKTTGVRIYKNVGFGGCDAFLRKLKWEDAPHRDGCPAASIGSSSPSGILAYRTAILGEHPRGAG